MRINQLKGGAILSYVSMGLGYVISILYTPIMLRFLGQSEYGLYNLISSVVSYLGLLSFGFGSAYIKYYSKFSVKDDKDSIANLNGIFIIIFTTIGLVAFFIGLILVSNLKLILGDKLSYYEFSRAKMLMLIMVINIALTFPASVFNSYITANEHYIFQKLVHLIKTVLNPIFMLPVLIMGFKSVGMVIVTTILNIVADISNVIYCSKKLRIKFRFKNIDMSIMKDMAVFSSYIFINMIIDQINWNVDKFLLGRYRGTIAVAVYGLAAQLNSYYMSLSTSISHVFIPRINKMVSSEANNNRLTELFTRIGRLQFIVLAFISSGLIFFGKPFISMWGGKSYSGAYTVALLLIIPVTVPLIQNIGIEIQRAKNMHKFRSWIYLFIAIGNIILSIPLSKYFGENGAALGTAISLILGNGFIMNWYYHVKVGLDMKFFWIQIAHLIPAFMLPLIIGIIIYMKVDLYNIKHFIGYGFIYFIVYSLSMWFFGMNQSEKNLLSPISKFKIKDILKLK